ncbi:MAG: ferredoxin [Clostridia bacterium]|nr:ferredoxin [Clostridia bacterium]MDD4048379.1 ferredoxin [Clostridia bacterium]
MKVKIDQDLCIACGVCISLAPNIYDWDKNGKAKVIQEEVPEGKEDEAREALEDCPTEAIEEV